MSSFDLLEGSTNNGEGESTDLISCDDRGLNLGMSELRMDASNSSPIIWMS